MAIKIILTIGIAYAAAVYVSGAAPSPAFSFKYGDRAVTGSDSLQVDAHLKVTVESVAYPQFNAVEWVLWFENPSAEKSAILSEIRDGNFLVFFPTGVKKDPTGGSSPVTEWLVVGNPQGDITWSRTTDTGAARGDDHGTTFSVSCDFQVYDTVKYYGEISQADAA